MNNHDMLLQSLKLSYVVKLAIKNDGLMWISDLRKINDKYFLCFNEIGPRRLHNLKSQLVRRGYLNHISDDIKTVNCYSAPDQPLLQRINMDEKSYKTLSN